MTFLILSQKLIIYILNIIIPCASRVNTFELEIWRNRSYVTRHYLTKPLLITGYLI